MAREKRITSRKPAVRTVRQANAPTVEPAPTLSFPIVGIGASAGGLVACTALLKSLPVDSALAIVIVQHLDPSHRSLLRDILSRVTKMPVAEVEDGVVPEARHIYVIPPDKDVTIRRGALRLAPRPSTGEKYLPIDGFFSSLAEDQKSRAIGIVLSGTGSDGTAGLQAIGEEGGITLAQNPTSAQHPGMPESAIASGCVDLVLTPEEIAEELPHLANSPRNRKAIARQKPPHPDVDQDFDSILQTLRAASNIDFCLYRRETIRRRVARRMLLHKLRDLKQYVQYLDQNPAEVQALGQDVLIHVTSFFREPEAFDILRSVVFPKLLDGKADGEPIRIWVPGCSTGEEAYSIAIALSEFLGADALPGRCQIFATDVSSAAVEKARLGVYSPVAVADVSPERLSRFFIKVDSSYQISKQIRELCVFARHNLGKDPPFSRMDLISCRNVMIYLGPELQKRILSLFHYALQPRGYLLLGKAESPGLSANLFTVEDRKCKLYSRNAARSIPVSDLAVPSAGTRSIALGSGEAALTSDLHRAVEAAVWRRHGLAAFVVDADLQILHFQGNVGPYLEAAAGAASLHLFKLVRDGLVLDLRAALHRAKKENLPVRRDRIRIDSENGLRLIDLEVIPIKDRRARWPDFLVLIEEAQRKESVKSQRSASGEVLASLKHELASTREKLQSIIEGQEATNEELETAQEELQSSNEELTTLNDELQNRNSELVMLADDLSNLLVGVNLPIVILGADRRIRRFTPAAEPLLNLIPSDVGRPIGDIKSNLNIPDLDRLLHDVVEKLSVVDREVQSADGHWYSLRMRPHKGSKSRVEGVLMALMDINVMKRGLEQFRTSRDEAVAARDLSAAVLDLSGALVVVTDPDGNVIGFNKACQDATGYTFEEARNRNLTDLLVRPSGVQQVGADFGWPDGAGKSQLSREISWVTKDGSRKAFAWSSLAQRGPDGYVTHVISTGIDITARAAMGARLRDSERKLKRLTASLLSAQEEERKRLARELHDDVNQRVAMLANDVDMLERTLSNVTPAVRKQLHSVRERIGTLSDDLRRAAHQLHPSALEHFGLVAALESYCSDFTPLHGIKLAFAHQRVPNSIPDPVALCVYRVAQECLRNVAKHSRINAASVTLTGDKAGLTLAVEDKGVGFDLQLLDNPIGLGLVGLRERVRLVNGTISILSAPAKGTRVEVRIPLNEAVHD